MGTLMERPLLMILVVASGVSSGVLVGLLIANNFFW